MFDDTVIVVEDKRDAVESAGEETVVEQSQQLLAAGGAVFTAEQQLAAQSAADVEQLSRAELAPPQPSSQDLSLTAVETAAVQQTGLLVRGPPGELLAADTAQLDAACSVEQTVLPAPEMLPAASVAAADSSEACVEKLDSHISVEHLEQTTTVHTHGFVINC